MRLHFILLVVALFSLASPPRVSIASPTHRLYLPALEVSPPRPVPLSAIYVVAGQSNAMSMGYSAQASTSSARMLTGSTWSRLIDPFDPVPTLGASGSWVVPLANRLGGQVGFVPTAVSATRIGQWAAGSVNYNRMVARARLAGAPITAVLWWQGESDRIEETPASTYRTALADLALRVRADLGAPLVVAEIGPDVRYSSTESESIRGPQRSCWATCPNVVRGPSFADVGAVSDGIHFRSDTELALAGGRWATALTAAGLAPQSQRP